MDDVGDADSFWVLHSPFGDLHCGAVSGRVDVSHPELGLHHVAINGRKLPGSLLCIRGDSTWPLAVAEAYVRGNDLVARYQPVEDWPYSPHVYWCADRLEGVQGLIGSLSLLIFV